MSLIKSNSVQIGQSTTGTNNFTLSVPSSPDGTIKLARGNSGATTQDILSVNASGNATFNNVTLNELTATLVTSTLAGKGSVIAKSYGTSASSSSDVSVQLKMAYGTVSLGANTSSTITNLPFTSVDTYVAYGGQNAAPVYTNFALGGVQRISGSNLIVYSQDDVSSTVQWLAIGV
jgi:hypothetical protein